MSPRPFDVYFDSTEDAADFLDNAPMHKDWLTLSPTLLNDEGECMIIVNLPDRASVYGGFVEYCRKAEGVFDYGDI